MGSKNLMGIIADTPDAKRKKSSPIILELNKEVARGKGSQRFRERGTWANYEALNPVHAVPEMNFVPTGTTASFGLHKPMVEQGTVRREGRGVLSLRHQVPQERL